MSKFTRAVVTGAIAALKSEGVADLDTAVEMSISIEDAIAETVRLWKKGEARAADREINGQRLADMHGQQLLIPGLDDGLNLPNIVRTVIDGQRPAYLLLADATIAQVRADIASRGAHYKTGVKTTEAQKQSLESLVAAAEAHDEELVGDVVLRMGGQLTATHGHPELGA